MPKKDKDSDAVALLKNDHDDLKDLFDEFEQAGNAERKAMVIRDALAALKVHIAVEENILYPMARKMIEGENETLNQADEEHHVAKILIAELEAMNGREDNRDAKFMVLAETFRRHMKSEGKMFKKIRKSAVDLEALAHQMAGQKAKLMAEGVPPDFETEMIRKCGLRAESPSKAALKHVQAPARKESSVRNWKQARESAKQRWEKLTDDDLAAISGDWNLLVERVQQRYGIIREEAERQVEDWRQTQKPAA